MAAVATATKDWTERFDSVRAEHIKLHWLDLSVPESKLTAKIVAELFECSESHVYSIVCAHKLNEVRKEKLRELAKAKSEHYVECMKRATGYAAELSEGTIRRQKAISEEVETLTKDKSLPNEEITAKLKNLKLASEIHKIAGNDAMAVQQHAIRVAEISKSGLPEAPAIEEKTASATALESDSLLFDDEY